MKERQRGVCVCVFVGGQCTAALTAPCGTVETLSALNEPLSSTTLSLTLSLLLYSLMKKLPTK